MSDTPTRIALITGASRGIGEASARLMARHGRHVVLVARGLDQLEKIAHEITQAGGKASVYKCDITDHTALAQLVEKVADDHGRLDILVNNAGITRDNLLLRMTDEEFDDVIACNLRSCFVTCRAALRQMMRGKFGRIINVSSVSGVIGNPGQANYAAAKSGLIGFTKTIAKEMASKKITANVVAPGFVETAMTKDLPDRVKKFATQVTPLQRFGKPEELAAAINFLTSEDAGFITGQVLCVDGGMSM
ncbi:MAG: 3-oxoacyl-[acyl-carrier-protein] reductase [Phycisphaeraceae bacterium]|nr:3-oxoacyl-[acyl-carrier-protein] reductase [Phycisphaeraceae bacterium]